MNVELLLYTIIIPFVLFVVMGLNLDQYFKKGHIFHIRAAYLILTFSLSYLVVSFIKDLVNITSFY